MKLSVTFRHSSNRYEPVTVYWNIRNNPLATRWVELLKQNILLGTHPLEKTYCLQGWQDTWISDYDRNLEILCDHLNQAIDQINHNLLGYHIDLFFSIDKLKSNQYRTLMNDIHHHFEILIGQVWNVSEWYKAADPTTRQSIRQLNNLCHEIEHAVKSIKKRNLFKMLNFFGLGTKSLSVNVSQNGKDFQGKIFENRIKWPIIEDEFDYFEYGSAWGDIELYYCQLGKPHRDAWGDNDEFIDPDNISSTMFISGEFIINFHSTFRRGSKFPFGFRRWLKKHNFPISKKFGYATVAEIDLHSAKEKQQLADEIVKRNDLYQIALLDDNNNVIIERKFDYTWKDQHDIDRTQKQA